LGLTVLVPGVIVTGANTGLLAVVPAPARFVFATLATVIAGIALADWMWTAPFRSLRRRVAERIEQTHLPPANSEFVGLSNYVAVVKDSQFWSVALNTVILIVVVVLVSALLGLLLALLLDRAFLGRGVIRTLLITPFLITPVAGALVWKTTILDPTNGILNWVLSLVGISPVDWIGQFPLTMVMVELIWQWTPFMMLLILAGLTSMPRDQLEAGRVDGAGAFQLFRELTLPHLRRFIELGVVLGAIYLVNTFDAIFMMTQGGPGVASANLPFYIYQRAFLGFDMGQAAAMGVVVVIFTMIIASFALRLIFKSFSGKEEAA